LTVSSYIPRALDEVVRSRAGNRCEYCRLAQAGQEATFHIDHVHPRRLGGETVSENLALACVSCSLRKGAASVADDPNTGDPEPIFHPRRQVWHEHFRPQDDGTVSGLTATGRATISRLRINRVLAVQIRFEEIERGRYP